MLLRLTPALSILLLFTAAVGAQVDAKCPL
jgi:hypothetical protein